MAGSLEGHNLTGMRSNALRWAATAITVVTLTLISPAVSSATTLAWEPCPDRVGFDCAVMNRPISAQQPKLGTFGMALARHRATDPSRRIGVLVVNPGGPGQSGVDFTFAVQRNFSPEVLARFDIVGFDPRGVGRSQPVQCSAEVLFGVLPRTWPTKPGSTSSSRTAGNYVKTARGIQVRSSTTCQPMRSLVMSTRSAGS